MTKMFWLRYQAGGFLYAAKRAQDFASVLIKNEAVFDEHIESALLQLNTVTKYILKGLEIVELSYPEVHEATQPLIYYR